MTGMQSPTHKHKEAVKHGQDPFTLSPAVTPDSDGHCVHCVHTVWSQSGQTTIILAVTDLLQIFHPSYTDLLTVLTENVCDTLHAGTRYRMLVLIKLRSVQVFLPVPESCRYNMTSSSWKVLHVGAVTQKNRFDLDFEHF